MPRSFFSALLCSCLVSAISAAAQTAAPVPPTSVMIVGGFHMANPGHDIHNVTVDDVLLPKTQAQIVFTVNALGTFHPTKVMAEWPAAVASTRFASYLAGTLPPSRNEVVQLGFRLAKTAGLSRFYGIDADGDFPYDAVQAYAKAHGQEAFLSGANSEIEAAVQKQAELLRTQGVAATLRFLNDPKLLSRGNEFYRQTLRIGGGKEQPGADLLTAWYRRNFLICANIVQNSAPGDRIVVFYGSGHAFLLRQCIQETPGFVLVEPNSYLPK